MADEAEGAEEVAEATTEATPEADSNETAQETNWRQSISDDATRKLADRYTTPADLAKALREANTELSSRVRPPDENASEEDVAKFRKAMGVPEASKDYAVTKPEHYSDEAFKSGAVQERVSGFTEAMHKAGASGESVKAAMDWYFTQEAAQQKLLSETDTKAAEDAEAGLRKERGADYEGNKIIATDFIKQYGGDDILNLELKDGTLLGSNPHFVRLAAQAGRRTSEGTLQMGLAGTEAGADVQKSYDDLSEQIYNAHRRGESDKAKRLDAERAQLSKQLFGDRNIGG